MYRIILSGAHKDINGPDLGSILDVVQWAAFNNMLYDPGFKIYTLNVDFPKAHSATARFRCFDVAFIGDVVKPLKIMLPAYQEIEERLMAVILEKYGVDTSDETALAFCPEAVIISLV